MARNTEVIRQWEILREIDGARIGITIAKLAASRGVHQRTIRRDIDALCSAGFPLYDDKVNGSTVWKLKTKPFHGLEGMGLGVMELCALYLSRTLLTTFGCAPFSDDAERAIAKIERALPASCRRYLDNLPVMLKAKTTGRKRQDDRRVRDVLTRALDASLAHRRVSMRYHSHSSRRTREYVIEPLRLTYADGGVYLTAWVPEYAEMRNFAAERIQTLAVLDDRFDPRPLPAEPFANSLGAFSGPVERVEIEFDAATAEYLTTREWHRTQTFDSRRDGSVVLRLDVSIDLPLRRWILGFGASARVLAPASLAQDILEQLTDARDGYLPRLAFEMMRMGGEDKGSPARCKPVPTMSRAS
jgi:predicted DNA-binding transcriptional regulator YafY